MIRAAPPRLPAPPREPLLPMINVVFLLLIFFLIMAQIPPPPPVEVTPPETGRDAEVAAEDGAAILWIDAAGGLAHLDARGAAALDAVAAARPESVLIRADAAAPATRLAEVIAALGAAGITDLRLVTLQREEVAP